MSYRVPGVDSAVTAAVDGTAIVEAAIVEAALTWVSRCPRAKLERAVCRLPRLIQKVGDRRVKIRLLGVLPVLALACVGLTGCDSKAGTAAVVGGHKISESDLSSYLHPDAPPVQSSDGSTSIAAKTFALQYLVQNEVFPALLAANGSPVTAADLATAKSSVLQGGDEQVLVDQITKSGFTSKFEPIVLRNHELLTILQAKLTSNEQATAAIAKLKEDISISPRYGSWNPQSLSLVGVGKKQLPSVLSFDGTLPGDAKLPTQQ